MNLLKYLERQAKLSGSLCISYDELVEWPAEQVEEAKQQGYIVQIDDADGIICRQCSEHCWKDVEIRQKDGRSVGVFFCEDEDCAGLIEIELERLQLWRIDKEISSQQLSPQKPAETGKKDEPCNPLSWIYEMHDSVVWKEFRDSGEQWVGAFDPILRFHEDTESLTDILTLTDCITHLKKILPYWIEYQFVSPKSDILAEMTHTIRCWLIKVRHNSNQKLPPIPPDLIGMVDWIPVIEKILAGGTTRKETETEKETKENIFRKEGDKWIVVYNHSEPGYLNDIKGMGQIAQLLAKPHKTISAFELASPQSDSKLMTQGKVVENDAVSSGSSKQQEIIDKDTLQSCQNRVIEINNELAEAEKNNDSAAQERLAKEKEQILNYIQSSCKPTGQNKSFPNDIEKARKAVTIAIRRALDNIKEYNAPLYQHLDNSIQRGIDFAYKPERNINWEL